MIYIPVPFERPIVFRSSRGRRLIKGIENKTELLLKEVLALAKWMWR